MARLFVPLDVNFPDDDKIEAVGLAGAGLYAMALCVAKRLLEDGRLTRVKLYKLGADDALIDRCIDVGLFTADAADAVRITAWLGHNKPAESVLTSDKAKRLAHVRHHTNKDVFQPECRFCVDEKAQVDAQICENDAERIDTQCADALPEVEVETETTNSSLRTTHDPGPESQTRGEDQQQPVDDQTIRRTAALVGRAIADQAGATNPGAYATTVTTGILQGDDPTDRQRITTLLEQGQDPEAIAATWTPDPLAGLFNSTPPRAGSEPARPALRPFDLAAHEAEAEAQRQALDRIAPAETP